MVYLDNSATTKPWPAVMKSYEQAAVSYFGNPSSLHRLGSDAETLLKKARESLASLLQVKSEELIFTSGGTEGNNLAIKGIALQHQNRGKHIITSSVEHPSVKEAFSDLQAFGFEVTYVPVDKEGKVHPDEVEKAIRQDTILVSIIHVNNEMGTIQPIEEIGNRLKKYPKLYFHTDHVQGAGLLPLNFQDCYVDMATISGHKFHGLKGTGLLYKREGVVLSPLFHGGGQEQELRPGTENVPGVVAMAKALRLTREQLQSNSNRLVTMKDYLMDSLLNLEEAKVNTPIESSAMHIVNVSFPGMKPEVIVQSLTKRGFHISTKSACSSKLEEPSEVIQAAGLGLERAKSAVRISLSIDTEEQDVKEFVDQLKETLTEMNKVLGAKRS
ncbi:cysteine desulfurase family protein [Alteribacillus iranensis]|uniref:Cysteine desulfurase n=1 Tax=Alteribacillus iranensis TaxID=930128 RepID=A0A1I2CJ93_9BACI|nr:cysteine desulfurase family protein [Alteribacillus iranensis]SFE67790.1 cysteine desulfurase [Alteribacillus iranensis]